MICLSFYIILQRNGPSPPNVQMSPQPTKLKQPACSSHTVRSDVEISACDGVTSIAGMLTASMILEKYQIL